MAYRQEGSEIIIVNESESQQEVSESPQEMSESQQEKQGKYLKFLNDFFKLFFITFFRNISGTNAE